MASALLKHVKSNPRLSHKGEQAQTAWRAAKAAVEAVSNQVARESIEQMISIAAAALGQVASSSCVVVTRGGDGALLWEASQPEATWVYVAALERRCDAHQLRLAELCCSQVRGLHSATRSRHSWRRRRLFGCVFGQPSRSCTS